MEFKQTGLPFNPSVYKAFMLYSQNVKSMPAHYQHEDYPVRVAQVLQKTVGEDAVLLSASLLTIMPPETYGIIEDRFGKEVVDLLTEANRQTKTGHEHVVHASERLKLLCMASAVTSFDDFKKMAAKMDRQIASAQEKGHLDEPLLVVRMPDLSIYDRILEAVSGKTSSSALADLYAEKLEDIKAFNINHMLKLQALGIVDPTEMLGLPDKSALRFPAFEDTGLLDDPKVREAYDIIIRHDRVLPENFEGALEVGRLLSNAVASPNPTAIAAALIDVGVMGRNEKDIEAFKDRLDWDVIEVLTSGSIYDFTMTPARIMKAPVEFRQISLANAVSVVENILVSADALVEFCEEKKDELPPNFLVQNLSPMALTYIDMNNRVMPTFGTTDLPELEARLEEKMKAAYAFLDAHLPKQPGKDQKPKNGGPSI